jgi:hypothetical protein
MAHDFVAAGGTCVLLAASMPMCPAAVSGERSLRGAHSPNGVVGVAAGGFPPFALAAESADFLLVAVSVVIVVMRSRLAAVSC